MWTLPRSSQFHRIIYFWLCSLYYDVRELYGRIRRREYTIIDEAWNRFPGAKKTNYEIIRVLWCGARGPCLCRGCEAQTPSCDFKYLLTEIGVIWRANKSRYQDDQSEALWLGRRYAGGRNGWCHWQTTLSQGELASILLYILYHGNVPQPARVTSAVQYI